MQIKRKVKGKEKLLSLPNFAPDATRAGVKALPSTELKGAGVEVLVVNTYHLMLKPGADLVEKAGGIHKFMSWDGWAISDSGGYQVFSLVHRNPELGKVTDDGVKFKNVYNGDWEFLTPEDSIKIQMKLGTDIMVLLDDVRPTDRDKAEMEDAVWRTLEWAKLQKQLFLDEVQKRGWSEDERPKLVAVIQGGPFEDLRELCAKELLKLEDEIFRFDGFGFGGNHLDADGNLMENILQVTAELIPDDRFKFALGIGRPRDIEVAKSFGWNLFDCTIPTREARHGKVFFFELGELKSENLKNAKFKEDFSKIDDACDCGCSVYNKAYLHHLLNVKDPALYTILEKHNLKVYTEFVKNDKLEINNR